MTATVHPLFKEAHVSVSQINKYLQCPRAYKFRYIDKIAAETRSSSLVFGTAVHEALALFYSRLKNRQDEPTLDEMVDVFAAKFNAELEGETPVMFSEKETPDGLIEEGKVLLDVFLAEATRPFRVLEVEMPFSVELTATKRLVGVFDAVVQDEDLTFRILEHKTAIKRWSESRIASDLQITVYQIVAPMIGFEDLKTLDIQLLLKTKKSGMEVYSTTRTEADKTDAMETIKGVIKAVEAGAFYPCRDWWCGSCEFAARCMVG